MIDYS